MAAEWTDAPDVQEIAEDLIERYHGHLASVRIRYLRRSGADWSAGGKVRLGQAVKVGARERHLHGADFLVLINGEAWENLSPAQRKALVDHELCHCGIDDNTGACMIVTHDVEEFGSVIARHGMWNVDVMTFAQALQDAPGATQIRLDLQDPDVASDREAKIERSLAEAFFSPREGLGSGRENGHAGNGRPTGRPRRTAAPTS